MVATIICFLVGYVFTYIPIFLMTLISKNRRDIRKLKWTKKCGMLTSELSNRSIIQLYYYPLFLYERILIAGIIVYLNAYPAI